MSRCHSEFRGGPGIVDVDGGAVDEEGARLGGGQHLAVEVQHNAAVGQHGQDDLRFRNGRNGCRDHGGAVRPRLLLRGGHGIEGEDLVSGLDQIGGHGSAHMPQTQESDLLVHAC